MSFIEFIGYAFLILIAMRATIKLIKIALLAKVGLPPFAKTGLFKKEGKWFMYIKFKYRGENLYYEWEPFLKDGHDHFADIEILMQQVDDNLDINHQNQ